MFRELFKTLNGVSIAKLNSKYRLPINEVVLVLNELQSLGLVDIENITIFPKPELRSWIYNNRVKHFFSGNSQDWKKVPDFFKTTQLSINEIPSSTKLKDIGNT